MTDEQRLQLITEQLIIVRDNLFRGLSKSMQKLQAQSINEVLELPNYTQSAKQEQGEPVAWAMFHDNGHFIDAIHPDEHARIEGEYTHPLYTQSPQQRTWVGLTEEDFVCVHQLCDTPIQAAEYVNHLLKEKNT